VDRYPAVWNERLTGTSIHTDGAIDAGVAFAHGPVALLISMDEDGHDT
jgi:hypothetical protein